MSNQYSEQDQNIINSVNVVLARVPANLLVESMKTLPLETIKKVISEFKTVATKSSIPRPKMPSRVKNSELTSIGNISLDIFRQAREMLTRYRNGEEPVRRLNMNRDFYVMEIGPSYRMLSIDAGVTWEVMTHANYDKRLAILNR